MPILGAGLAKKILILNYLICLMGGARRLVGTPPPSPPKKSFVLPRKTFAASGKVKGLILPYFDNLETLSQPLDILITQGHWPVEVFFYGKT